MTKEVGLWIDHRHAVIVMASNQDDDVKQMPSQLPKHVRYSGASEASGEGDDHNATTEDGRDRRFSDLLNHYYDAVITELGDATTVFIMGPGEAKIELQKRLEQHPPPARVVTTQVADKMTDHQIVAEVKQHFHLSIKPLKKS